MNFHWQRTNSFCEFLFDLREFGVDLALKYDDLRTDWFLEKFCCML